jgi:phosphatidylglycerophosphatase A
MSDLQKAGQRHGPRFSFLQRALPNHRFRQVGEWWVCRLVAREGRGTRYPGKHSRRSRGQAVNTNSASDSSTAPTNLVQQTTTEGGATAPLWATAIATFFGVGRLKPGPGTWGSGATVLLWAALFRSLPPNLRTGTALALAALAAGVGIPAATRVSRASGKKDPQSVVIDEVAGQLIALIGVPLAWKTFVMSFILFRAFDIVKLPPIRQLEKLPEGTGIVLDDVAAGICALVVMQLMLHSGLLK